MAVVRKHPGTSKNGTQFNDGVTQQNDYEATPCSFSSLGSKLHQRQGMALRPFEIDNIPIDIASDKQSHTKTLS
jgi:hypothetical protein